MSIKFMNMVNGVSTVGHGSHRNAGETADRVERRGALAASARRAGGSLGGIALAAIALLAAACSDDGHAAPEQPIPADDAGQVADDAGALEPDAGSAPDAAQEPADAGAPDSSEPEPVPALVGTYCAADGAEWLFGDRQPVAVWSGDTRREGSPTVSADELVVHWTSSCAGGDCVTQDETTSYALEVGDGWIELDGQRLTFAWRGRCGS